MVQKRKKKQHITAIATPDMALLAITIVLVVFGLLMLSSAGAVVGYETYGDAYWHVKHQLVSGVLAGGVALLTFLFLPYHYLQKMAMPIFLGALALLAAVFLPGIGTSYGSGARSWINLGISFQPSEIAKLALIIYLAAIFAKKEPEALRTTFEGIIPLLGSLALIGFLIVLQPDIGTLAIIAGVAFLIYILAGGAWLHVSALAVTGAGAFLLLIKMAPYRTARFMTFLHPELDPQGIGYHINQAFLALGSGGILGRGFGHSRQKYQYLPEVTGDSIFAIIGEELGFFVAALVVFAFFFFIMRGFTLMRHAPDAFGKLLAGGIISWIGIQAFLNIGAMVGVFPLTGIPLPFISFGGTALVMELAAVGILLNISRHTR